MNPFEWFINAFIAPALKELEQITTVMFSWTSFKVAFSIEDTIGISQDVMNALSVYIAGVAFSLLTAKLVHKLFGIYLISTDGDDTISPFIYAKNYLKGIVIIAGFSLVYPFIVDIAVEFITNILTIIGNSEYATPTTYTSPLYLLFMMIYNIFMVIFLINFLTCGIRLLFLRLTIPLSTVGLIDNDNGIYSIFIKKFTQTIVTIIAQMALVQFSLVPIRNMGAGVIETILGFAVAVGLLCYAKAISNEMNEIFLASPASGAGQKLSSAGMGLNTVMSLIKR